MPAMKIGRIVVLIIIGIFLCLSVVLAQLAYRIERTLLSYTYTSKQVDRIISPLYDPAILEDTVDGTFSFMRRELSLDIPSQLRPYILTAAKAGFNPEWFTRTTQRMLFNIQLVLNGRETTLSLPVSINGFKLAFMDVVRREFDTSEYLEIDREVSQMPSSLDLADEIPADTLDSIVTNLQRVRFVLTILQYLVPGVLMLACFAFRRIGSGFAAVGAGLLAGGLLLAVAVGGWATTASQSLAALVRSAVPPFLSWVDYGIAEFAKELIAGVLPVATIVIIVGAVLAGLGFFIVFVKGDPEIRMGGEH